MGSVSISRPATTPSDFSPIDIARQTEGPPSHRLMAILVAHGITDTAELAALTGLTIRSVQHVRSATYCVSAQPIAQKRNPLRSETQPIALNATHCARPIAPKKEIPPTPPKEKTTTLDLSLSNPTESSAAVASAKKVAADAPAARKPSFDLKALGEQLAAAVNGSVCPQALALQSLSVPLGWLEGGADLDLDVVPTLEAIGKRCHGQGITSWQYFTRPVAAAVKARKQGLPDVAAAQAAKPPRRGMLAILRERTERGVLS